MRPTIVAAPLLLATLLAATAPCAQAGAGATTRISGVTLGVIDLTPQDGASAGFTFDTFSSRLIAYTDARNSGGSMESVTITPLPLSAGTAHTATASATANAATSGAIGDVSAYVTTGAGLGQGNLVSADSEQRLWLTLAPHTLLTISGNVLTEAQRTLGAGEGYRVFTWASVDITDRDVITSTTLTRESPLIWGEATTLARNSEYFMLAYANPGAASMQVGLNFLAYADIAVTAVPEPSTYLMLLGGLLLTGAAAFKRGRREYAP